MGRRALAAVAVAVVMAEEAASAWLCCTMSTGAVRWNVEDTVDREARGREYAEVARALCGIRGRWGSPLDSTDEQHTHTSKEHE